jgi:hypothetical protein
MVQFGFHLRIECGVDSVAVSVPALQPPKHRAIGATDVEHVVSGRQEFPDEVDSSILQVTIERLHQREPDATRRPMQVLSCAGYF